MKEGFDIGLEMSGNPDAFRDMLANMCHGGKIAMLGIPTREIAIDWNTVVFNMITIKGIYGREMYETWYKMTRHAPVGARHQPGDHPPLRFSRIRERLRRHEVGRIGQSHPDLARRIGGQSLTIDVTSRLKSIETKGPTPCTCDEAASPAQIDEIRKAGLVQERARALHGPAAARRRCRW